MRPQRVPVWRSRQGLVALAVVAIMTIWRAVLLRGSFFNQDDYYLTSRAYHSDLTWAFLVRDTAGHVNPAQQLVYWIVARTAPFDWTSIALFLLVIQLLTVVVFWHLLSRLLPGSWIRIPLLAAVAFAPLTLTSTLWWSAAMGLWPPLLAMVVACLFLVRAWQGSRWPWLELVGCVLAVVVGLLWHERAILIPPVLVGVAVCLADEASGWRRLVVAVRRVWRLWLSLVVLGAAFLVAHGRLTDVQGGASNVRTTLAVAWAFIGENVVPGLAGGPWQGRLIGGAVDPALWVVVVSLVLAALGVLFLLSRGGPARRWALAILVAYVAADLVLLIVGRGGFGRVIGLDSRYSADVVIVAALCVALGLRGAPFARPEEAGVLDAPAVVRRRTALGVAAVYTLGAAVGTALLVPHFQNVEDREYFTNLRNDLAADESQVLYDNLVPPGILLPLLGEEALISNVLAPLPDGPVFDQPSADLRVVADNGRLGAPELVGAVQSRPGPLTGCGYAVTSKDQAIRLTESVSGRLVLRLEYFTDHETTVRVAVPRSTWETSFRAMEGPHEMFVVVPDLHAGWRSFTLAVDGSSTVCVTRAEAGAPSVGP